MWRFSATSAERVESAQVLKPKRKLSRNSLESHRAPR